MEKKENSGIGDVIFKKFNNQLPKNHNKLIITDCIGYYEKNNIKHCIVCEKPLQTKLNRNETQYLLPTPCDCEIKYDQHQQKKEEIQKCLNRIPDEFKGVWLKDLSTPVPFVKPFIDNFTTQFKPNAKGLHIYGNKGSGKTFACKCIINELSKQNVRVFAIRFTQLLDVYTNFNYKQGIKKIESKIKYSHLIYLDDVGATRETDYAVEKINDIINFIYELRIPIIITSNLSRGHLGEEIKENTDIARAYDRLFERCHPIKLENESFRLAKAKEDKAKFDDILGLS